MAHQQLTPEAVKTPNAGSTKLSRQESLTKRDAFRGFNEDFRRAV